MSTRYKNGSHYENHPKAAEMHDLAAHAHFSASGHGQEEHLTDHERSRIALEHSGAANDESHKATVGHGVKAFNHADIAALAHEHWVARGCPAGSSDEDWFTAVKELRSRAVGH